MGPMSRTGQAVQVDIGAARPFSYEWHGQEPLKVGDRVLLPANWVRPDPFVGTVVEIGTEYTGELASVLEKLP